MSPLHVRSNCNKYWICAFSDRQTNRWQTHRTQGLTNLVRSTDKIQSTKT